ncbi:MAG TPA: choice-of-anchor D domain-containing protein, partial [Blastocatellia bacterium]|nr:choice-of-anchor D domain-containing protein [Blastocatellia bacterium]
LYVVTDCTNASGSCVAGANSRGFDKGESLTPVLTAGTQYFIVVDSPQAAGEGPFHFSLRRGRAANDSCSSPTVIEANRLPFSNSDTTFGAANDLNPALPCLRSNQSANGPDVFYQFTSGSTENYDITVTPRGNYDVTLYVVTDCATLSGCSSADVGGNGVAEQIRRVLNAGTTYYIAVDGFQGDAGDFTITVRPTVARTPAAPTGLVARAVSSTQIDLSWADNSGDEQGFRIERSLNGSDFTEVATVNANVNTFSDTGLTPETTYFYRVLAFNNFGNSEPSNVAADTTPPSPVPTFPVISVSQSSINFGSVRSTQTATRTITITNAGGSDLVVSNIINPLPPFSIVNRPATPFTIQPGQSRNLTVQFAPTSVQRFVGSFTIQSNAPTAPNLTINLEGIGTSAPVPNLEVNQGGIDFPGGSGATSLELKNTGEGDLIIASIQSPGLPFSVGGAPALPVTLKSGERILLTVNFAPTAPGVFSSSILVVSNDPDALLLSIPVRGTSTPQSELFKLRAPAQFTAVAGTANTINVLAVNGVNTDIRLTATAVAGGVFTDRGNGRGDLVLTPAATATGTAGVTFTATAGNLTKTAQTLITIIPPSDAARVQITWTAPQTAPGPPTGVAARDLFITPLSNGVGGAEADGFTTADAAGLVGYVIYRERTAGVRILPSNIVGVVPATQTSFTDTIAMPAGSSFANFRYYYRVTALYATGTESEPSNETSTLPKAAGLQFKSKSLRFTAANSNVAAGAVLIVDGTERFTIERDGDILIVRKNARSTPGGLKVKDIFKSGSPHQVVILNPNGMASDPVTFTR